MTLKLNGYSTAQFGKCHEVPPWQTSPIGPFDAWPSGGGGFEYFYGFIGGENNQYYPALYDGLAPVEPEKTPEEGYHLTEDLADRAIDWVRTQKSLAPDKPFFVYFAPGATHAPHHVPAEWADKYAGRFADGWDAQRESIFEQQKQRGVVPADADLTARPDVIPAWDDMDDALKPVLERQMEVYAGFLEHTDFHVGRVIDAIEAIGALENTLVYYIIGDNGASAEGTVNGAFNEMANFNGLAAIETPEFMAAMKDKLGTPDAYNHYSVGWAWAMCAPYQWTKQVASHWGGTRNGTIVHWPAGIASQGRGPVAVHPRHRRGTDRARGGRAARAHLRQRRAAVPDRGHQHALQLRRGRRAGTARPAVLRDGRQPRHLLQGLERGHPAQHPVAAERGAARRSTTTCGSSTTGPPTGPRPTTWPREMPERLAALQRLWLIEAVKYNVLPIDDRRFERLNPTIAGRPQLVTGTTQVLFPGMKRLSEHSVIDIKNRSFTVTAAIETPQRTPAPTASSSRRAAASAAGRSTSRTGRAKFVYNLLGMQEFVVAATEDLPTGQSPGPGRVRLRRWRSRQGRRRHPLLRRTQGRHRSGRHRPNR